MADQRIAYTEEMVGSGHPTKSDTLNRLATVEHGNDGTHTKAITGLTASKPVFTDGSKILTSSGTCPLDQGGTGQTTKGAAFDALSPMDGAGQIIYGGASGTGTKLAAGSDGQVLVSNGAAAPGWEYQPKQNLLTNSQWIACSGSTLENVGSDLVTNGGFDSDTTGWTAESSTIASIVGGTAGNCLEITRTGDSVQDAYQDITTVVGKIYEATCYVKSGTSGNEAFYLASRDIGGSNPYTGTTNGTSSGSWVQHTLVFEAGQTTTRIYVSKNTATAGTMLFDSVTLYEVTPGYVAADNLAPDGWAKESSLDVWRQHNDATYTKGGSFYSIKTTTSAANQYIYWPVGITQNQEFLRRFAGRTVTLGCWIYASDASHARVKIYDDGHYYSAYHTGAAGWEWIEVTHTFGATPAQILFALHQDISGKTAYFSQPMLVFGSSIGQGNYQPIPNEVIWVTNSNTHGILSNTFDGDVFSDVAWTTLNLESDSNGMIGKGVKAVLINGYARDSGSAAATDISITFSNDSNGLPAGACISNGGITNSAYRRCHEWQLCSSSGDIDYNIDASGSNTYEITIRYHAIQT